MDVGKAVGAVSRMVGTRDVAGRQARVGSARSTRTTRCPMTPVAPVMMIWLMRG